MSDFQVNVVRVAAIEPIEGADRIELAVVGEYRSVVAKDAFKPGDLAVYLPEQAILPEWLIERLNLVGKLSGGQKNRIKAVKLRGTLSQGILIPIIQLPEEIDESTVLFYGYNVDTQSYVLIAHSPEPKSMVRNIGRGVSLLDWGDLSELLGVVKFDPMQAMDDATRRKLNGECAYIPSKTVKYDFENWKKYPNRFAEGDEVVITEKLHGTMCCFAFYPGLGHPELPDDVFVYSKGLGARGQVFKWNEVNSGNLYIKAFRAQTRAISNSEGEWEVDIIDRAMNALPLSAFAGGDLPPVYIFGEVYGKGVQDLSYGEEDPQFRAFDIWVGTPEAGGFVDATKKFDLFRAMGVEHVPVLYQGPFNRERMLALTDGKTTLNDGTNIREGVVITSAVEEVHPRFGRKILKNVSGDYLTRKGNTTEFN